MATTFDRLVAAGAPRIHEPYSYRITEPFSGALKVVLRKDRPLGGTEFVASYTIDVDGLDPEAVLPAVVAACRAVVAERDAREVAETLVGEYAPHAA
jgi:hypothetical protein